MLVTTSEISVKGKIREVPAIHLENSVILINGKFLKVAEIFDEYWLQNDTLPDPVLVLQLLRGIDQKPDLFTFAQRVPATKPRFEFHLEWDNIAAIQVSSYDTWFRDQISSASRRNIRASEKKGVVVRSVGYDEEYIKGIMSIYNESPVRGGRKFWHYGKCFSAVRAENGTYQERSTFLGAYFQDELIGYMKIVWDIHSAAIMQIISKMEFREKRPNNALLAEAVRLCSERKIPYLLYERFVYDNKPDSSLTRFKRENGFVRIDIPRYYVPLTAKGRLCLKLGLHKDPKILIPKWLYTRLIYIRDRWCMTRVSLR